MSLLRVMTYNIHLGGLGGPLLDQVVRAAEPDVLVVNESPHYPVVWRRQCRTLARRWAMDLVVGGRPAGSLMLLVRPGLRVTSRHQRVLGRPPFRPRRGVVSAEVEVGERRIGIVGCHLSLHPDQRWREVESVMAQADSLGDPVVVAGDLNERPTGPCWGRLREAGFVDHGSRGWLTFPADSPVKRIDALLVRGDVTVSHHGDPGVPAELLAVASDHRPVLAVLAVRPARS
jgi:endonuclease/exonuclease/phosphatase family metal-dependent hydrolase